MKRIIVLTLTAMMFLPVVAMAQDTDDTTPAPVTTTWRITTSRTIIWMGDTITAVVNGSANVTVSLQLRPWNSTSQMFGNVSWQDTARTDRNGSAVFFVNTDDVESWGNFTLVLMQNEIPLARKYITINYDPYRWLEILIDRNTEHDLEQDADIEALTDYCIGLEEDNSYQNKVIGALVLFNAIVFVLAMPTLINYYNKKVLSKGKRSKLVQLLTGIPDPDDRRIYYGGVVTADQPVTAPTVGKCADKDEEWHDIKTCPTCQLAAAMQEYGFEGLTHKEIINHIKAETGPPQHRIRNRHISTPADRRRLKKAYLKAKKKELLKEVEE